MLLLASTEVTRFYTYLHCKPDGTPFYVGKGCGDRAFSMRGRNRWHRRILAKYGKAAIQVWVFYCSNEDEAFADERLQIASLRAQGYELCNISDGGEGTSGYKHTEEAKKRIGDAAKGNQNMLGKKASPETKAKLSAIRAGRKLHPHSDETKAKISEAKKGIAQKPEVIAKRAAGISKSRSDPVVRSRRLTALTKANNDPEVRRRKSDAAKEFWRKRKAGI
jgi:hypothetical protein